MATKKSLILVVYQEATCTKQGSKNELNSMLLNLGSGASLATFATRVRNRPHASNQNSLRQESTLLASFRLSICDAVDDQANTTLGDDIRDAVSHLDGHNCVGAGEANHWKDVHNWVCQPANNCPVLRTLDQALHHRV